MDFTLKIEGGNSAFGESSLDAARELSRILDNVAAKIVLNGIPKDGLPLRDTNGSIVGRACLAADAANSAPVPQDIDEDFVLSINADSSAFRSGDGAWSGTPEIARILQTLAYKLHSDGMSPQDACELHDANGNAIGKVIFQKPLHTPAVG